MIDFIGVKIRNEKHNNRLFRIMVGRNILLYILLIDQFRGEAETKLPIFHAHPTLSSWQVAPPHKHPKKRIPNMRGNIDKRSRLCVINKNDRKRNAIDPYCRSSRGIFRRV